MSTSSEHQLVVNTLFPFSLVRTKEENCGVGLTSLFLNHSTCTPIGKQKAGEFFSSNGNDGLSAFGYLRFCRVKTFGYLRFCRVKTFGYLRLARVETFALIQSKLPWYQLSD